MSELVLHHYPLSPYSEKIRAILGYKGLAWRSVETPILLPKPDLTPLTGGYRRAPVLQIGRDIYCDSALIARVIDRLHPEPALSPTPLRASGMAFAAIEQTLFFAAVPTVFQPAGLKVMLERMGPELMERFSKDRAALFAGGSASRPGPEFAKTHFLPMINALDLQLAATPYLLGDAPTLADFCMFHPVWFIRRNAGVAPMLDPFHNLIAWFDRMTALGHGRPTACTGAEAIELARQSPAVASPDGPLLEPEGVRVGANVTVSATDYGVDAVAGRLIHASVFELVIKREDARAGEVIVHFPRAGYRVLPA